MPSIHGENPSGLWRSLEDDPAVIYVLDPDFCIRYCNRAWDRFAAENGGSGLERERQIGRSVMEVIPPPLQALYRGGYGAVSFSGQVWELSYECSSPGVYRSFRMSVYPEPDTSGLVVVNSLSIEHPHGADVEPLDASDAVYADAHGQITMCCHCRRTWRAHGPDIWDWVPAYLETPSRSITHGLCPLCNHLLYRELARE
jgi:hypothetical protein